MKTHLKRALAPALATLLVAISLGLTEAQQSQPQGQPQQTPAQPPATATQAGGQQPAASTTNPTNRMIYPAKGQSPEQQQKDQQECYNWAVQQSGFDPVVEKQKLNQTGQQAQANANATQGQAVKGAARGAVAGVAIGAIAGDAGKGAAIGATAGGLAGGMKRKDQVVAEQAKVDQASQQYQQGLQNWDKAFMTCMQGKGYTVN